jgi:hypothetical protein
MKNKKAGYICGDPLSGLCQREVIEAVKIYDGRISRIADQPFTVALTNLGGTAPYTFVSAVNSGTTVVTNLLTTLKSGKKYTVAFDAVVPVTITHTDVTRTVRQAPSSVTFHRELTLNLPDASVIPYSVSVTTSLSGMIGSFTSGGEATFRACIIQIVKVVAPVDILVPSYGYAVYPESDDKGSICRGFENLPLFPPFR